MRDKPLRAKRGTPEFREEMVAAGRLGGRANVVALGIEHMKAIGRRGRLANLKKHGQEHMKHISSLRTGGADHE